MTWADFADKHLIIAVAWAFSWIIVSILWASVVEKCFSKGDPSEERQ